jgi:hypothetical protein
MKRNEFTDQKCSVETVSLIIWLSNLLGVPDEDSSRNVMYTLN